jgi:hypothetical protein
MSRLRRDRALEAQPGDVKRITLLEKIYWWWNEPRIVDSGNCRRCGQVHSVKYATSEVDGEEQLETDWMEELHKFEKNIFQLCFRIGVEVEKFASAKECIKKLREHTMKQRRELEPLFQDRARLIQDLDETKKINAALQVRRSIEKLSSAFSTLRNRGQGDTTSAWNELWTEIWANAAVDNTNPFRALSQSQKYEFRNAAEKGKLLFADMSAEIHQYDSQTRHGYKYFHPSTQAIVDKLQPTPDPGTGEVNWEGQLAKFGVLARQN